MSIDERAVIKKAQDLGAVFKKSDNRRWFAQGEPFEFRSRLEAAYDYLEQHAEFSETVRERISESVASNLNK